MLASEIYRIASPAADFATLRKAVVTSVDTASTPPVLGVQVSGDTNSVQGVRFMDNWTPRVGATVVLIKQGSDICAWGHVADQAGSGHWQNVTLASGFSHDGNSNGNVQYRRVYDNGSWKMQWRGGAGLTGTPTTILNSALSAEFRPSSKRSVLVARNVQGGSPLSAQIDFATDGTALLIVSPTVGNAGGAQSTSSVDPVDSTTNESPGTDSVDPVDSTTSVQFIPMDLGHDHFNAAHSHGVTGAHSHTVSDHTHSVTHPSSISFNNVEYFL
ncbi:hypothetical protein [Streptomyces sp. NPDC001774]